jgi:hypothetical protein
LLDRGGRLSTWITPRKSAGQQILRSCLSSASHDVAGRGQATGEQDEYVINRITVGIIPKVWTELLRLMANTKFNRTDVVNRAISIYAMVDENVRNGHELVFRDPETGKERIVEIV